MNTDLIEEKGQGQAQALTVAPSNGARIDCWKETGSSSDERSDSVTVSFTPVAGFRASVLSPNAP